MTLLLTYLVCNSSSTEIVAAPYISLGYHAIGADMSLAAIEPSSERQGKVVIRDIISADLSTRQGRIKNAVMLIRLVKVLRALECIVVKDADADTFSVTL